MARDPPPGKEAPQAAVAHCHAAGRERSPQLLASDVRSGFDKAEDQASTGLDTS